MSGRREITFYITHFKPEDPVPAGFEDHPLPHRLAYLRWEKTRNGHPSGGGWDIGLWDVTAPDGLLYNLPFAATVLEIQRDDQNRITYLHCRERDGTVDAGGGNTPA